MGQQKVFALAETSKQDKDIIIYPNYSTKILPYLEKSNNKVANTKYLQLTNPPNKLRENSN
jgi:hypothetical protein